MKPLSSELRNALKAAVISARRKAEEGSRAALRNLAVDAPRAFDTMDNEQQDRRRRLRQHGRQLGDRRDPATDAQSIDRLVHKCAFEHWHRMLFARFLAENGLLIEPQSRVTVSIAECIELARARGEDPWVLAARWAQGMLPEIFKVDDPVLEVSLLREHRQPLEKLVSDLPSDVFLADDALGWSYQFWQTEQKKKVNESGVTIGPDELPAVTQLFTEHYMVQFLLHNTIGAWHAGKMLAKRPELAETASTEEELREAVRIPGCDFEYLRFVRDGEEQEGPWRVGAGTYPQWPREARSITVLDPCCGSGHFLVSALDLLMRLRMHEEGLSVSAAIDAVLRENLFGLELDQRCTQIAAFAVALHCWKAIGRPVAPPPIQVACCGLSVGGSRDEWVRLAGSDSRLRNGMEALYELFAQAPVLGSLIDPERMLPQNVLTAGLDELRPLLERALVASSDEVAHEAGVAASGMVEAARLLGGTYTLVVTNPPYLIQADHCAALRWHGEMFESDARQDLSTMFVSRGLRWCGDSGSLAMVTPHSWLRLKGSCALRQRLLRRCTWTALVNLGPGAFETIGGDVVQVSLVALSAIEPPFGNHFIAIDASSKPRSRRAAASEKAALISGLTNQLDGHRAASSEVSSSLPTVSSQAGERDLTRRTSDSACPQRLPQLAQLNNPHSTLSLHQRIRGTLLGEHAGSFQGLTTGDDGRLKRNFWELLQFPKATGDWRPLQGPSKRSDPFSGRENVVSARFVRGELDGGALRGRKAWGREGVAVNRVGSPTASRYSGDLYHSLIPVLVPRRTEDLAALVVFCSSPALGAALRADSRSLSVDNGYFNAVPFDPEHWRRAAAQSFPCGLPKPQTNDPLQWLFHGHPAGMTAAGLTHASPCGIADSAGADRHASLICRTPNARDVLQVAVARIAGFRWPAELDEDMPLDVAAREWSTRCAALGRLSDDDGIVPINATHGELSAADRVADLLQAAFENAGVPLTPTVLGQLLAATGSTAVTIDEWLRNDFFQQHCSLFTRRPFVWHIWDGRADGFNVLVHYHRLAGPNSEGRKLLEKLTFTYVSEWIERQRAELREGREGAEGRLAAAERLQRKLELILEGDPPYDIFVRWKPLAEQPIGWDPDINDGVRLNIRPFCAAGILRVDPGIDWGRDGGGTKAKPCSKSDFPWFWSCNPTTRASDATDFPGGAEFTGERWNALHYSRAVKLAARERARAAEAPT